MNPNKASLQRKRDIIRNWQQQQAAKQQKPPVTVRTNHIVKSMNAMTNPPPFAEPVVQQITTVQPPPVVETNPATDISIQHRQRHSDPAFAMERTGFLTALRLNAGNISTLLQYGYLSTHEARVAGLHPSKHLYLHKQLLQLEGLMYKIGGWPEHLREMIHAGATEPPMQDAGKYRHTPLTRLLPAALYDNENTGVEYLHGIHLKDGEEVPNVVTALAAQNQHLFQPLYESLCRLGKLHTEGVPRLIKGDPNPLLERGFQPEKETPPPRVPTSMVGMSLWETLLYSLVSGACDYLQQANAPLPDLRVSVKNLMPYSLAKQSWAGELKQWMKQYQPIIEKQAAAAQTEVAATAVPPPAQTPIEAKQPQPVKDAKPVSGIDYTNRKPRRMAGFSESSPPKSGKAGGLIHWWKRNCGWLAPVAVIGAIIAWLGLGGSPNPKPVMT
jgi:hypothetical protein